MKKLLLLLVFPALLFGGKSSVQYDTITHGVVKPPTAPSATFDLDFTGLNIGGLTSGGGGGGTPGGADRQLQFNNAFTFGGIPYATYDGTAMTFRTGSRFMLADPTDILKKARLDLSAIASGTTRQLKIAPSADSVTVVAGTAAANNFVTGIDANGVILSAQPTFSNLSGLLSLSQTTMSTGKLIGRSTAGTGAMEEITVGTNLTLAGGVLDASGGGGGGTPGGADTQFQYNNSSAFGGTANIVLSGGQVKAVDSNFVLKNIVDATKQVTFSLANVPTATTETVLVANAANPVIPKPDVGASDNFLTGLGTTGIFTKAQPTFANISGSLSLGQQSIPIGKERFVDPTNGNDGTGSANLAKPYLTIAAACAAASSGDVIYLYPNTTGYNQSTTPLVIPAGVTIVGAGPDTTVITGAVTGVTRGVVEPSTASAIYNVTMQNTSSTGFAFGVGSASTAFTSAYLGGSKIVANAQGIYINKAGTSGLVVENTTVATQNDCFFQNISTATTELRNCDFVADGSVTLTESKGLNVMNGTVRFDYGSLTVGGATGTNVGAFASGATSVMELRGVRIANSLGGATNYDVQQQSSATVGVAGVFRSDAGALATNGTVTELSRYAVRDNNLSDFPNIGSGTRGDIIYRNATGWTKLAAGIDGNVLTTHGTTADPEWLTGGGGGGAVSDTAFSSAWNAATTTGPSQNAAYDYFHIMSPADNGKIGVLNIGAGIPKTDSGGLVSVATDGTDYLTPGGAATVTNKRITKRQLTTAVPGPTPSIVSDTYDVVQFTGMNADITIDPTGTPQPPDTLRFNFTDDGTPRGITWPPGKFEASPGQALPTITTASTRLDVLFARNSATGKWRCLASSDPIAVSGAGTVTNVAATGANGITVSGSPITASGTLAFGLPITLAGTAGKTLTVSNSLTLTGTDGSTLNVGSGGTLGTNAFNSTAFLTSTAISDSVFAAAWNGDTTTASSRNAIYDEIHAFDTDDNGKVNVLDLSTAELVKTNSSGVVSSAVGGTDYANLAFKTVAVSGQTNVVAGSAAETLNLAAGTNVTLTTTPGTHTVTIASSGGGGGGATLPTKQDVGDADATISGDVTVINLTTPLTASRVITLPAASTYSTLLPLVIEDPTAAVNGAFTISVARAGSDTINGGTGNVVVLGANEAGGAVQLISDGTSKWTTISKGGGSRMTGYVDGTTPTNGNALVGNGTKFSSTALTKSSVGLSNVTNDAQTKASVMPNTVPTTGQLAIGQSGGFGYAPVTIGGSGATFSLNDAGVLTISGIATASLADPDLATWAGITPGTGVGTALAVNVGTAGSFITNGGSAGTPSSIVLTGGSSLPVSAITASTSTPLGVGSLELGHASDTTIARASAGQITVEGTAVLLSGGAGGTPSSLTLTNATGLPVSGITGSTSTALGVGSIELGHATDTTLARASAGRTTVEGIAVELSDPRVDDQNAPSSPYAPNSDSFDMAVLRGVNGALTINAPTGTPGQGRNLVIRIKDDGTARALTFQTGCSGQYRFSSDMAAPSTTVLSKTMYLLFKYNSTDSRWDNVAQLNNF